VSSAGRKTGLALLCFARPVRHVLFLIVIFVAAGLAACSDSSRETDAGDPSVAPVTAGSPADLEAKAFLRDFVAIRGAIDLAGWRDFQGLYYATVDYARRLEHDEGAALLDRELPPLLENVIEENRQALAGIQAVSPETRYGEEFLALQIESIRFNIEAFADLHGRFARAGDDPGAATAWTEFSAWADRTNPQIEVLDRRLDAFYGHLPAPLREAFDRGVAAFDVGR
jgi:hypothetical protein